MSLVVVLLPLVGALLLYVTPSERLRPMFLPVLGGLHLAVSALLLVAEKTALQETWIGLDPLGEVLLIVVSVLFFVCTLYAPSYLLLRRDRPNRIFSTCLALFLSMASLVAVSQHLGMLWVAMEAMTLATAPLIYFNRNQRSIEATWKYLVLGSVGIALALFGSFVLSYAAYAGSADSSLLFQSLTRNAANLSRPWLRTAFVFLLVGYGTKMGLAPLHTWKPDAYGEAPGIIGALLAGGSTSCAFVALLRVFHIVSLGGEDAFARRLLLGLGLFSMLYVAVFMARQRDIKRMLAYSSVEQMGILLVGIGVGGTFAALLHMINNAFTKGWMFLAAGNIHRAFGTKRVRELSGVARGLPVSGLLFLLGLLAITGSPPFGPFVSLFSIFDVTMAAGRFWVAGAYLVLMGIIFLGMGSTVVRVVSGEPPANKDTTELGDNFSRTMPIFVFAGLVLLLGIWMPPPLEGLLQRAAAVVGRLP